MHSRPSISDHEDELGLREQFGEVTSRLEGEWIFVAEAGCWLAMVDYNIQDERGDGLIQHLKHHQTMLPPMVIHFHVLTLL